jgi:hypothetical protein
MDLVLKLHNVFYEVHKYSIHAEQDCIRKCDKKYLKDCYMVLLILNNNPNINVCSCDKCTKLINKYKIKKVYCISIPKK